MTAAKGASPAVRLKNKKAPVLVPLIGITLFSLVLSCLAGSVRIPVRDVLAILRGALTGEALPSHIDGTLASVLLNIRLPRAFSSFLVGGMLSVAGCVMQALLQNPLASSYTLGVSSGASLGAALVVVSGLTLPVLNAFALPLAGFLFALGTVLFVLSVSMRLDAQMSGHTVILLGMVVSLFMNAMLTLVNSLSPEHMNRILMWQMGSFAGRRWYHVAVLLLAALCGTLLLLRFHAALDILSFGDEQAKAIGVPAARIKQMTLALASLMTGAAVCFTGTIGFVDLIVPHIVRRIYGPAHIRALPLSFFYGGSFLALADTAARTLLSPREIPVGAVTALLGTPFFIYLYFVAPHHAKGG